MDNLKIYDPAKLRKALRQFMLERKLSVLSWTKRANLSESSLRNFLNGVKKNGILEERSSMTTASLTKLAVAEGLSLSGLLAYADRVEVTGFINKSGRVMMQNNLDKEFVAAPPEGDSEKLIAYEVEDGVRLPQLENVKTAFFSRATMSIEECLNLICALKLENQEEIVIGKVMRVSDNRYNLTDINYRVIEDIKISWISKIRHSTYR